MTETTPSLSNASVVVPREAWQLIIITLDTFRRQEATRSRTRDSRYAVEMLGKAVSLTAAPAPVLVIELDQPRIADDGNNTEQQPHAPSEPSKDWTGRPCPACGGTGEEYAVIT